MAFLAGCTPGQYARQADKTAYRTIDAGQKAALDRAGGFDITYRPIRSEPTSGPATQPGEIRIGDRFIPLSGDQPCVLALAEALEIAFRNNRDFQTRKETLYISGLALANAARAWNWTLWGGNVDAAASHIRVNETGETNSGSASGAMNLTRKFAQGGALTLASALNYATDFSGANASGSLLSASLTQPLLRGAWRDLAYEQQYRLERDFIFAVFEYERFTQTFAVDVVSKYYSLLQARDQLENEQANIERLQRTFRWTRMQVDAGQVSLIEQDQAEQNLLNAQVRLQQSRQSYEDQLDRFKVQTLALPIRAGVDVDYPAGLEVLRQAGPKSVSLDEAKAMDMAMLVRPDAMTEGAKVRDADRNLQIAADAFNPQLDLTLDASAPGKSPTQFYKVQFNKYTRSAGATFSYDLDQTNNRDAYRRSLIDLDRAKRNYAEFVDRVKLDVRSSYRALEQLRNSHQLQVKSLQIAMRRSKLASLQQQEGLASARDVLEAEEDLRNAQNGLTSALVSYTTTRLSFMATLGMLQVDQKGALNERDEPFTFERIARRYPYVTVDSGR